MPVSMTEFLASLSVGVGIWFFVWGMNRVYLMFKGLVS